MRRYGAIGGTTDGFKKMLRKLVATGKDLFFCYEAGPCGYNLYRYIVSQGHQCIVVAPSLIPKKAGDKVKTDKRDADNLARLLNIGVSVKLISFIVSMQLDSREGGNLFRLKYPRQYQKFSPPYPSCNNRVFL